MAHLRGAVGSYSPSEARENWKFFYIYAKFNTQIVKNSSLSPWDFKIRNPNFEKCTFYGLKILFFSSLLHHKKFLDALIHTVSKNWLPWSIRREDMKVSSFSTLKMYCSSPISSTKKVIFWSRFLFFWVCFSYNSPQN